MCKECAFETAVWWDILRINKYALRAQKRHNILKEISSRRKKNTRNTKITQQNLKKTTYRKQGSSPNWRCNNDKVDDFAPIALRAASSAQPSRKHHIRVILCFWDEIFTGLLIGPSRANRNTHTFTDRHSQLWCVSIEFIYGLQRAPEDIRAASICSNRGEVHPYCLQ